MTTSTRVCTLCGAAWVGTGQNGTTCGACGVPSGASNVALAPKDFAWARVEARAECPECSVTSPLNGLLGGPTLSCAKCGASHAFEGSVWRRLLPAIHEIVDLSSISRAVLETPALQSGSNPHGHVGRQIATRDLVEPHAVAGRARLTLRVSPGLPVEGELCGLRPSGNAMTVLSITRGTIQVQGGDGKPWPYALTADAMTLYPALRAVVAPAHRADYSYSILKQDKDSAHICCSRCGAPGKTSDGVTLVCAYCGTTSLVSDNHWHMLGIGAPRIVGFWILFEGPSAKRQSLSSSGGDDIQAQIRAAALAASGGGGGPRWG